MEDQILDTTETNDIIAASFGKRFVAYLIDVILLSIPVQIVQSFIISEKLGNIQNKLINDMFSGVLIDLSYISNLYKGVWSEYFLLMGINIVIAALYYTLMEASSKQATFGKMAIKIVVVDSMGNKLTYGRALGRYLARIVTAFTFLIGYLMMLFTKKSQTLHDMMAGCLVIEDNKVK